jgi:hypothetical protein
VWTAQKWSQWITGRRSWQEKDGALTLQVRNIRQRVVEVNLNVRSAIESIIPRFVANHLQERVTAQHSNNNTIVYPVVIVDVEGVKCRALLNTGADSSYTSAALLDKLPKRESKRETQKVEMMLGTTTREMELQTINVKANSGQFSMAVEVTKGNLFRLTTCNTNKLSMETLILRVL